MDFCHLIVTCLFSMLRLPFDNQKVKGNYAIFFGKRGINNNTFNFLNMEHHHYKNHFDYLLPGYNPKLYTIQMVSM